MAPFTTNGMIWHFFNFKRWIKNRRNPQKLHVQDLQNCRLLAVTLSSLIYYKIFDVITKLWLAKLNAARMLCFRKRFILRNTTWVIKSICSRSMLARKAGIYFVSSLQNYTQPWNFIYIYKYFVTHLWHVVVQNRSVLLPTSLSRIWVNSQNVNSDMSNLMTKWSVRPAKTQISQGISPVWSESSLWTQWVAKDPSFLHADRLIQVFAGRTDHFVGFVMWRLILCKPLFSCPFLSKSWICFNWSLMKTAF